MQPRPPLCTADDGAENKPLLLTSMISSRPTFYDPPQRVVLTRRASGAGSNVATFAGAIGGTVGVLALIALGVAISICRRRMATSRREARERGESGTHAGDGSIQQSNTDDRPQMRQNTALPAFTPRYFPDYIPPPVARPRLPSGSMQYEDQAVGYAHLESPPGLESSNSQGATAPPCPTPVIPTSPITAPSPTEAHASEARHGLICDTSIPTSNSIRQSSCDAAIPVNPTAIPGTDYSNPEQVVAAHPNSQGETA